MSKDGNAQLVIPSDLAYSVRVYPALISPSSTLTFDVELIDMRVESPPFSDQLRGASCESPLCRSS